MIGELFVVLSILLLLNMFNLDIFGVVAFVRPISDVLFVVWLICAANLCNRKQEHKKTIDPPTTSGGITKES